jgi:hypothetical protein
MKLDAIKKKALTTFLTAFDRVATMPGAAGTVDKSPSFSALLPFVRMLGSERQELREFADQFASQSWDTLAPQAKEGDAWRQMLLRAREEGIKVIEAWDVRCIGRLIDLFPDSVPKQYRDAAMTCYMADDADSTWMVDFDTTRRRHQSAA